MRLWSLHPCYLDRLGLLAVWREALLAQSVLLQGEHKGKGKTSYYNHPQLDRFRNRDIKFIKCYLLEIAREASKRGYFFNYRKITSNNNIKEHNEVYTNTDKLAVTVSQLFFEFDHLQKKLLNRDPHKRIENKGMTGELNHKLEPHPLFKVVKGGIEKWEKIDET